MDDFDDDDFDDFDDLNIALLQELETKAIQSIQSQQAQQDRRGGPQEPIAIDDNDDVDPADAEVFRELARLPAQNAYGSRLTAAAAPPPLPLPAYSQTSFANVPLPAANNAHKAAPYYSRPPHQMRPSLTAGPPHAQGPAVAARSAPGPGPGLGIPHRGPVGGNAIGVSANGASNQPTAAESSAIAALQARVRMLETDLYTAQGKASMMHEKYESAQRKHETDIQKIQKQNSDELARQRQRAEEAIAAHKSAATELEFARQDLREEVEKSKKGRRTDRADGGPMTPKKNTASRSTWNVADGFEDIELLPSPSKGFGRRLKEVTGGSVPAVERTPTKGKRRRPITDSPSKALETLPVEDADIMNASPGMSFGGMSAAPTPAAAAQPPDEAPFVFIQEVLGHQSSPSEPSTVELFSRYSFPSNRKQTLAFLMLQRIPKLEGKQGTTRLMLDFCQLVLGIWSQCIREEYHAPVRALVSLLSYIVSRDPVGLAPHIFSALLPMAQETIYLVAAPAFNTPSGSLANHPDYTVRQLAADIDSGTIMALLKLVAFGCLMSSQNDGQYQTQYQQSQMPSTGISMSSQAWFWSKMEFEFVLLMLSSKQSPDAFLGMLSLLRTSALPESIGPITNDPSRDPGVVASMIIDRISHHIDDPPKWSLPCKYTEWDVRLAALGVLDCFAQSPFGKLSLAASDCTLPRLVGVLFPAYRELQDRDLLKEPLHPPHDLLILPDAKVRSYGIGGFDLDQTLGLTLGKPTGPGMASVTLDSVSIRIPPVPGTGSGDDGEKEGGGGARGDADGDRDYIPLVLLYVSSVVYLLHSILTDPYTASVANIPAKLGDTRGAMQGFYLLTMARLGFRADPAFSLGFHDETYRLAAELFKLAATPEEDEDYSRWAALAAQGQGPVRAVEGASDPFSDKVLGENEDVDMMAVKIEKTAS